MPWVEQHPSGYFCAPAFGKFCAGIKYPGTFNTYKQFQCQWFYAYPWATLSEKKFVVLLLIEIVCMITCSHCKHTFYIQWNTVGEQRPHGCHCCLVFSYLDCPCYRQAGCPNHNSGCWEKHWYQIKAVCFHNSPGRFLPCWFPLSANPDSTADHLYRSEQYPFTETMFLSSSNVLLNVFPASVTAISNRFFTVCIGTDLYGLFQFSKISYYRRGVITILPPFFTFSLHLS